MAPVRPRRAPASFILWYVPALFFVGAGSWTLVLANALGAAGGWLWAAADEPEIGGGASQQPSATS